MILTLLARKASQIFKVMEKHDAIVGMFLDWPYNISNLVRVQHICKWPKFKDALGLDAWNIDSWELYDGVDGLDIGAPSIKL